MASFTIFQAFGTVLTIGCVYAAICMARSSVREPIFKPNDNYNHDGALGVAWLLMGIAFVIFTALVQP